MDFFEPTRRSVLDNMRAMRIKEDPCRTLLAAGCPKESPGITTFPRPGGNLMIGSGMAKPNYSFEKRRREMERKSKKQQKADRKLEKTASQPENAAPESIEATPSVG